MRASSGVSDGAILLDGPALAVPMTLAIILVDAGERSVAVIALPMGDRVYIDTMGFRDGARIRLAVGWAPARNDEVSARLVDAGSDADLQSRRTFLDAGYDCYHVQISGG